jgi:hypothetical protein
MKAALGLTLFLAAFSLNSWSQEIDYDKRNMHIFCASHLTLMSESIDDNGKQRQALAYLSGMHRDEARQLGANQKHFDDVAGYLKKTRNNNKQKWKQLSFQSRQVCLPDT